MGRSEAGEPGPRLAQGDPQGGVFTEGLRPQRQVERRLGGEAQPRPHRRGVGEDRQWGSAGDGGEEAVYSTQGSLRAVAGPDDRRAMPAAQAQAEHLLPLEASSPAAVSSVRTSATSW